MRNLPPLNALRAFEAAARHLSFTKAAEELRVTQSAVSQQVRKLEGRLGVRVFGAQQTITGLRSIGSPRLVTPSRHWYTPRKHHLACYHFVGRRQDGERHQTVARGS